MDGTSMQMQCKATVIQATALERWWTQLTALLEFTALYEVGFERRES